MKTVVGILLRVLLVILVLGLLVAGARKAAMRKKAKLGAAPVYHLNPLPVHAVAIGAGPFEQTLDYLSVVEPLREARLSSRLTAVINEVRVDEGDLVKKGDVLLTLDNREILEEIAGIEARIAQAEADLAANEATAQALARSVAYWDREAERDRKLAADKIVPTSQAEGTADKANEFHGKLAAAKQKSTALKHLAESLRRQQEALRTKLSYCTITSPYDGGVRYRYVDPGDLATPGKPLVVVADRSGIKLVFDIPQTDLPVVKKNQPARIRVAGETREVRLSHLYPSLDAALMLRAEIHLAGKQTEGLTCGEYVPVSLLVARHEKIARAPAAAVIETHGASPYVYRIRDGVLHRTPVRIVGSSGDYLAVEGVAPGDLVVTTSFLAWARLADGMAVEVLR